MTITKNLRIPGILFILGLTLACLIPPITRANDHPNIIFLMTDDQRWDQFGCYGKPEFRTPNIDRLAEQGVIFDKAFHAVAICMPSRTTMMTGRFLSSHRVGFTAPYDYTLSQADFAKSYPALLKKAGYRTGFIGKVGFTVSEKAQRPNSLVPKDYPQNLGSTFDFFAGNETHDRDGVILWPEDDKELQAIYQQGRKGTGRTLKTGEAMLRFLETQPANQPFCLSVSFYAVKHDSNSDMYGPHHKLFNDYDFPVPENWVEGENGKLPEVLKKNARGVPLHLQRSSTPAMHQRLVRRFATQGYTVDQQLGLLVEKLKAKGWLDNTIIIYTSDNGRLQGSHGLFDKCILYEESVKAPLIVFDGRAPESNRGHREDAMISTVDIAPTILSLAGIDPPSSMQGRDLSGILDQTQDKTEWPTAVFMENLFLVELFKSKRKPNVEEINDKLVADNRSYRSRGVRTNRWKYFIYYEHNPPIEELYDLERDPSELKDLAKQPEYAAILKRLRQQTEELYEESIR